jgi:hypothetical protein
MGPLGSGGRVQVRMVASSEGKEEASPGRDSPCPSVFHIVFWRWSDGNLKTVLRTALPRVWIGY